jgi:hypothetical protein
MQSPRRRPAHRELFNIGNGLISVVLDRKAKSGYPVPAGERTISQARRKVLERVHYPQLAEHRQLHHALPRR